MTHPRNILDDVEVKENGEYRQKAGISYASELASSAAAALSVFLRIS